MPTYLKHGRRPIQSIPLSYVYRHINQSLGSLITMYVVPLNPPAPLLLRDTDLKRRFCQPGASNVLIHGFLLTKVPPHGTPPKWIPFLHPVSHYPLLSTKYFFVLQLIAFLSPEVLRKGAHQLQYICVNGPASSRSPPENQNTSRPRRTKFRSIQDTDSPYFIWAPCLRSRRFGCWNGALWATWAGPGQA